MGNWVTCKSASDPGKLIFVNLDQVVYLMDDRIGVQVTYAGGDGATFFVAGNAIDLLAMTGTVPSA
jgi:hypothetical protein